MTFCDGNLFWGVLLLMFVKGRGFLAQDNHDNWMLSICKKDGLKITSGTILISHPGSRTNPGDEKFIPASSKHINALQHLKTSRSAILKSSRSSAGNVWKNELVQILRTTYQSQSDTYNLQDNSMIVDDSNGVYTSMLSRQRTKRTGIFYNVTSDIISIQNERNKKQFWNQRQQLSPLLNIKTRKTRESGIKCSCTIRATNGERVYMSVQVKFYRLDSQLQGENSTSFGHGSPEETSVKCPLLSLVYDGSTRQQLACLGMASYQFPPIRLRQLGINLANGIDDESMYYSAFVINVTASGNATLLTSCNRPSDHASDSQNNEDDHKDTHTSEENNNKSNEANAGLHVLTTITSLPPSNNDQSEGEVTTAKGEEELSGEEPIITKVIPSSTDVINGTNYGDDHKTPTTAHNNPQERVEVGDKVAVYSTSPTSSLISTIAPILNESSEALSGEINQDENDSSGVLLVAVLTSLTVASIACGITIYLWRIRRLRHEDQREQSSFDHQRARPYRVVSLSRWLHRHLSQEDCPAVNPAHSSPHTHRVELGTPQGGNADNAMRLGHLDIKRRRDDVLQNNDAIDTMDITSYVPSRDSSISAGCPELGLGISSTSINVARMNDLFLTPRHQEDRLNHSQTYTAPVAQPRRRDHSNERIQREDQEEKDTATNKIVETTNDFDYITNGLEPNHNVLPTTGIKLPISKSISSNKLDKIGEDGSGKYSMARETKHTKMRNLGQSVLDFFSGRVFRKVLTNGWRKRASNCDDENSRKLNGSWKPVNVDQRFEETSSDGYETYIARSENKATSDSSFYRSFDLCDNYEVAKIYVHDENKLTGKGNHPLYGGHGQMTIDVDSESDGYDNFVVCQGCNKADIKSRPNVHPKDGTDDRDNHIANGLVYDKSDNTTIGQNDKRHIGTGFQSKDGLIKGRKKFSTIKYAEPKGKIGKHQTKSSNLLTNNTGWGAEKVDFVNLSTQATWKGCRDDVTEHTDMSEVEKYIDRQNQSFMNSLSHHKTGSRTPQLKNDLNDEDGPGQPPPLPARNRRTNKGVKIPKTKTLKHFNLLFSENKETNQTYKDNAKCNLSIYEKNNIKETNHNYHVPKPKTRVTKNSYNMTQVQSICQVDDESKDQSEC